MYRFPAQMFSVDEPLSNELAASICAALETLFTDDRNTLNCNPPFDDGDTFTVDPRRVDFIHASSEVVIIAIPGYDSEGNHVMDFPIGRTDCFMEGIFPQRCWGFPMLGEA